MLVEHASCPAREQTSPSGRRLRNRLIVVNAVAWIAIMALIGLVLF